MKLDRQKRGRKNKTYVFKDVEGTEFTVTNLMEFAEEHDLSYRCLTNVTCGIRSSYRGLTLVSKY